MMYEIFRIVMVNENPMDVHVDQHLAADPLDTWGARPDPINDRVRYGVLIYKHGPVDVATARKDAEHVFRVVMRLVGDKHPNGPGRETVILGPAVGRWSQGDRIRVSVRLLDREGFVHTEAEAYVDPCERARFAR